MRLYEMYYPATTIQSSIMYLCTYTKCAVLYACLLTFKKNYSQIDREFFDPIEKSITPGRYKKVSESLMKKPTKN